MSERGRSVAKTAPRRRARSHVVSAPHEGVLEGVDASLLDIVDHVLTKGVVISGDLVLGVADIDLVYLRLSAVLCAADRILGPTKRRSRARSEPAVRLRTPLSAGKRRPSSR
ncbi:MAG TPA: gas vesicle protein [Labilithrix sp.]|jgi:hypothetical protein|nr:gas vesicle protein [Labilithrix sp.]